MKGLTSFTGRSIILKNQKEQIYILNQQSADKKILIYELKENGDMESWVRVVVKAMTAL